MKPHVCLWTVALGLLSCNSLSAALTPEQAAALPPPASHQIDFSKEIKPILEVSCAKCHGRGKDKGGFRIDTRETLLQGGDSGPAVIPGKSAESYLVELVAGVDPDNVMPQKGSKLTPQQIGLLRAWIDQGVAWDSGVTFAKLPPVNLFPRKPELPAAGPRAKSRHPIDLLLRPYFQQHQIAPKDVVEDRMFARRVYLDVIGLLPTPSELQEFLDDRSPDKRERLVKRLLADNHRYAQHWLTFWNDLLRNDYRGTGYIDGGRRQITSWLYSALATNKPYDRFVAELINPTPESEGFTKGIVWRGVVNASQTPQMQAAQNISQVFMGVNLKCASCHDSFISDWTLADAYGLASIYADAPLEMVQCDRPLGKFAAMKFMYPELGTIDAKAPRAARLEQLAAIVTQERNGRLARTIVNRLWARFMGRGLVEPVDEMENPAWHQDLLDWLAADLVENGYDLKKTIERILTSQAYQMPAVPFAETVARENYVFRGPLVRRLSAEQYIDALTSLTGVGYATPLAKIDLSAGAARAALDSMGLTAEPKWIWSDPQAAHQTPPATIYFRKRIDLPEAPASASAVMACDNSFRLYVNGKEAGSGRDHTNPSLLDLRPYLTKGPNLIAVAAVNDPAAPGRTNVNQANPAGLLFYAWVRCEKSTQLRLPKHDNAGRAPEIPVEVVLDFVSDASWTWSRERKDGWQKTDFADHDWKNAVALGDSGIEPWNLKQRFEQTLLAATLTGRVRAALVASDPLMTALGRPNREQVITTRSPVATTLQALELTNGETLAQRLQRGADRLVSGRQTSAPDLIVELFERALLRRPTAQELALAEELIGSPVKKEGVEDLLWAVSMLPEFQLIY